MPMDPEYDAAQIKGERNADLIKSAELADAITKAAEALNRAIYAYWKVNNHRNRVEMKVILEDHPTGGSNHLPSIGVKVTKEL